MQDPNSVVTDGIAYFELRFRPNVALVSVVRRFVSEFYARVVDDAEVTERLALATHELLENAVKYSSNGETAVRVEVTPGRRPHDVCVRTWNRAAPEHLAVVEQSFRESQDAKDSFSLYQRLIERASVRTEGSGLGLARIRAEADMHLGYEVKNGEICIFARTIARPEENA